MACYDFPILNDCSVLEITLDCKSPDLYGVKLRYLSEGQSADTDLMYGEADFQTLPEVMTDPADYGQALWGCVFKDTDLASRFETHRAFAEKEQKPLRIRLFIEPNAKKLHNLFWETLRRPGATETGPPLLSSPLFHFSRYLSGSNWREVKTVPRCEFRALAVAAAPTLGENSAFAPVHAKEETDRVAAALGAIATDCVYEPGQATLKAIIDRLRTGDYDILYLVCHGQLPDGKPLILLDGDSKGTPEWVPGQELIEQLSTLPHLPRLVVLSSCESAAPSDAGSLAALGPALAATGIPAVIAMQGKVLMETVAQFMPAFFSSLSEDGRIDRAMSVARNAIKHKHDEWWMPALFMRLTEGCLWNNSAFIGSGRGDADNKWPALLDSIVDKKCVVIAGPGLSERLFGSQSDIAVQIAGNLSLPLTDDAARDLRQVAQYVWVNQKRATLETEYLRAILTLVRTRSTFFQTQISDPAKLSTKQIQKYLAELSQSAFRQEATASLVEPYRVLAALKLPIYVSTDPTDLLLNALREAGAKPQPMLCPWNHEIAKIKDLAPSDPNWVPSPSEPMLLRLFGDLDHPQSLLLTIDNYFDYLITLTQSINELLPSDATAALAEHTLLLAGVHMENWDFHFLWRPFTSLAGFDADRVNIAAQIAPDGAISDADKARHYIEDYLDHASISMYWGSSADFLYELNRRLKPFLTEATAPLQEAAHG